MGIQKFYAHIDCPGLAHVLYIDNGGKKTKPHQPFITSAHCMAAIYIAQVCLCVSVFYSRI